MTELNIFLIITYYALKFYVNSIKVKTNNTNNCSLTKCLQQELVPGLSN